MHVFSHIQNLDVHIKKGKCKRKMTSVYVREGNRAVTMGKVYDMKKML